MYFSSQYCRQAINMEHCTPCCESTIGHGTRFCGFICNCFCSVFVQIVYGYTFQRQHAAENGICTEFISMTLALLFSMLYDICVVQCILGEFHGRLKDGDVCLVIHPLNNNYCICKLTEQHLSLFIIKWHVGVWNNLQYI